MANEEGARWLLLSVPRTEPRVAAFLPVPVNSVAAC